MDGSVVVMTDVVVEIILVVVVVVEVEYTGRGGKKFSEFPVKIHDKNTNTSQGK